MTGGGATLYFWRILDDGFLKGPNDAPDMCYIPGWDSPGLIGISDTLSAAHRGDTHDAGRYSVRHGDGGDGLPLV